jgi:hypothetical protein
MEARHKRKREPRIGSRAVMIRETNSNYFTVALTVLSHRCPAVLVATRAKR